MAAALRDGFKLVLFVMICLSIGGLGGAVTQSSIDTWYASLQKPILNPPNWVFGPVWTALYILMGVAGWRVWKLTSSAKYRIRILFSVQLVLNAAWSFLFFGLGNPLAGLIDILILCLCLGLLTTLAWREERFIGVLLMPYLLWVSFATYLNASLWWLNR